MKKRLLSLMLMVITVTLPTTLLAQATAGDEAAEPYAVLSDNNTVLTFYYDDQKTTRNGLEVGPFNGDGIQTWYWQRESIINAVFDSSFANCTSITSTAHWFNGCKNMSSVSGIQYLKTDNVTDMKDMFSYCRSLPSIDVSGFNTSNVMTMSGMFALCESLTSLDVSGFKTDKVINMSSMFNSCKSLTTLDVSGFNTANVTDMAGMFFSCTSLTDLNLSNFNTANVTTMNSMFHYCIGLTNLDVSNFNTEKVTSMASMFWNCHSLTSLNISSFVTPYVTNVEDMFSECSSLTTILVGKGWSTGQISNGESMFAGCVNLVGEAGTTFDESHIDFTYAHIDGGISNPGYFSGNGVPYAEPYAALSNQNTVLTFYYDDQKKARQGMSIGPFSSDYIYNSGYIGWEQQRDSITSVVFDDSFSNYTDLISTVGWFFNCSKLETVSGLQNIHLGKLEDMSYMFYHCSALKSLDLSYFSEANLTKIEYMLTGCSGLTDLNLGGFNTANITDMNSMFSGCSGLTSLDLSSLNTENVTSMSSMFSGCSGLTSLDLSNFKTEHVTSMAAMFNNCSHLTSLDLSNFNTENVTTMYYMFNGCSRLKSLNMSGLDMTSLNDILYMFSGCSYLESIDLSNSVLPNLYRFFYGLSSLKELNMSNCNTSKMTTMKEMFSGCSKLITLDLSSFNTTNVTDMYCMFYDCPDLVSIDLSSFNTVNVTSMKSMFSACPNLMSIDVSGFNTESVTDMSSMFLSCPGLTSLDVTNFNTANVTNISHMFGSCTGLTSLDLRNFNTGNVTDMGYMFSGCTSLNTIYAGEGWSTAKVSSSSYMFHQCTSLVGGAGTVFDSSHTDHTYARIDGGTDNPGYFTRIGDAPYTEPEPYAVLSENNTVLMFYYDEKKTERNGMSVGPFAAETDRGWDEYKGNINTAIFDDSFAKCSTITSTAYWFASCYNSLTIQGLNNLKTDNVTDMTMMFHSTWLKDIDVSGFNTSKVTSMRNMFSACSMSSLDVSNFNTENVTDFNGMFSSNSHLTSLDLKNFNTANATSLRAMFSGCTQLTNIDLSSFNTANVTDMNNMFSSCTNLQHLDLSHFNTDKVRDIRRMFLDCRNLTSLDISSLKTDSVLSMEMLFENCAKLESLDLSSFNTKDIWEMRYMFDGCTNLKTIYVGSEWNTGKVSSGENMFRNCTNLVGGKGTTYDANHTDYTYAHIDGGPNNPGYFTDKNAPVVADEIIQFADTKVKEICVANWDANGDGELSKTEAESVTDLGGVFKDQSLCTMFDELRFFISLAALGEDEFRGCKLTSIILPPSLQSIGRYAFSGTKLTTITIPASVTYIDGTGLNDDEFLNFYVDKESNSFCSIDGVLFSKDSTLLQNYPIGRLNESYTIPNTVTTIGRCSFYGSHLRSVTIPEGVKRINHGAFRYCQIETIDIPNTVEIIEGENFQYCGYLTSAFIPSSVSFMGDDVLSACTSLLIIDVDPNNQYYTSIDGVLYSKNLSTLCIYPAGRPDSSYTIPDHVTTIDDYAFDFAKNLVSLVIPRGVTSIGHLNFSNNSSLMLVTVYWKEPITISSYSFNTKTVKNGTLYVPYGTKTLYEVSDGWKEFENIVEMAPEVDVKFDSNGVLAVNGSTTLADALSVAGGTEEVAKTITAIVWNSTASLTNDDLQGLDNPNMLIYVKDAALAPANRDNVVIGGLAKNIILADVESGNNNFYCPQEFTAEMISYTHEYRQQTEIGVSRGWESIALPFTVQTIMHEKNGVITPFGNDVSEKHFWLRQLTQEGLAQARKIEANTPYLISMPNNNEYPAEFIQAGRVTFSAQDAVVPVTQLNGMEAPTATGGMIMFLPCFQSQSAYEQVYALNVGEQRDGHPEGSIFVANYRSVRPFEAFTVHHGDGPAPQYISVFEMNSGTTGIEDVERGMLNVERWYDLNGRKLQKKPTKKGVYLNNGHKVVIK